MSRCLAWLTSLSLLLASSVSGQQDSQALLPGKWQGVGVLRGVPYHFCMSIARQNNQFKCVALVYSGLTKDQTIKASKCLFFINACHFIISVCDFMLRTLIDKLSNSCLTIPVLLSVIHFLLFP